MRVEYLIWGTFIFSAIIICFSIFLCIKISKRKVENWRQKKTVGKAEIVMWSTESDFDTAGGQHSNKLTAMARVIGIENQSVWSVKNLSSSRKSEFPIGSIIDVEYAEYRYMGVKSYIDIRYINLNDGMK